MKPSYKKEAKPAARHLCLLFQKMYNLPIASKSLGYTFDLSMILQSQAGAKGQSQDLKAACLHPIFEVLLLLKLKKSGPHWITFVLPYASRLNMST